MGQLPVTLCGERFLVFALKSEPRAERTYAWYEHHWPLCWRHIPTDYRILGPKVELPLVSDKWPLGQVGSTYTNLKSFRAAYDAFLAMTPEQQEVLTLKGYTALFSDIRGGPDAEAWIKKTRAVVAAASSADEIVRSLIRAAKPCPKHGDWATRSILRAGGGTAALAILEDSRNDELPFDERERASICRCIRRRLRLPIDETKPSAVDSAQRIKASAELQIHREVFEEGPKRWQFLEALAVLTENDPEVVAEFLLGPLPPSSLEDHVHGYVLGSYFGWRCGGNREAQFRKLLVARDPYIRVAAAVYLCFENEKDGIAALEDFAELDGAAGAWAALNLVRRGHKDHMPRVLQVFGAHDKSVEYTWYVDFEKRIAALLSNIARANGLPQPIPPEPTCTCDPCGDDDTRLEVIGRY